MERFVFSIPRRWNPSALFPITSLVNSIVALARGAIAVCLVLALTGCQCVKEHSFTGALWNTGEFQHFREVDSQAPVSVFYVPSRDDYLFCYTDRRDGDDKPRRRALLLEQNSEALQSRRRPQFFSTDRVTLIPVAVNTDTNVLPRADVNSRQITVHAIAGDRGPYPAPTYEESMSTPIKVALTPLAVTGDATVISAFVALIAAASYAQSGGGFSFRGP